MAPPLIATIYNYASADVNYGLLLFMNRLTVTPFQDLLDYFNAFPRHWDFLHGQTLFKPLLHLLGMKYFYIENEMCFFSNPHSIQSCHSNAAFLSNLWADFGYEGVFIGSFMTSVTILILDYTLDSDKSHTDILVYSFLFYTVVVFAFGSVTAVIGTNGGFVGVLFLLSLLGSSKTRTSPV